MQNEKTGAANWSIGCQAGRAKAVDLIEQMMLSEDPNMLKRAVEELAAGDGLDSAVGVGFFTQIADYLMQAQ